MRGWSLVGAALGKEWAVLSGRRGELGAGGPGALGDGRRGEGRVRVGPARRRAPSGLREGGPTGVLRLPSKLDPVRSLLPALGRIKRPGLLGQPAGVVTLVPHTFVVHQSMIYMVCDGHAGSRAAQYVTSNYHRLLCSYLPPSLPDWGNTAGACSWIVVGF